jgi:hypothetical protein
LPTTKTKENGIMGYEIKVESVEVAGTDKKGNAVFEARGTMAGHLLEPSEMDTFVARTIQYKGEPIFKLQETNEEGALAHLVMAGSRWNRGQRIAIARACKAARLEKFGEGHKPVVDSELEAGETVVLAAK